MAEHNLGSMIVLSATNYAIWKPRMEDILFCKDLHDPLENKGEKPVTTKDEEWRKMNRKTIGLIRQCIGHEVFHHVAQETSAYDLWIKLEEMYQSKTSRNKALLMRRLVNLKLQRETTLAEHTSEFQSLVNQLTSVDLDNSAPNGKLTTNMVMDALFNEEAQRREMGSTDQSESQALVSEGSKKRGRGQGRGHHRGTGKGRWRSQARDTAATAVMAVDESEVLLAASDDRKSNWVLDSGSAYHLCRDREIQRDAALRLVEEFSEFPRKNKEMLWEKKTGGLYRLEGNVQTGGATVRHGSNGISEKSGQGKQPLHRGTQSKRRGTWRIRSGTRAQGDALGYVRKSGQTRVMQPVKERWSHDNSQSDVLLRRTPVGGGGALVGVQGTSSYGGAGSEAVKKDNLKTSDSPPVGWRGRLLSPAHLDESKPTWMSPSPVAKPKPVWSSCIFDWVHRGGQAANVIPETVRFGGTFRSMTSEGMT
ncbi:hypothetical protein Acr_12g0004660 [Actinidia rufa]|uniref:Uncharacterized protein n=1 Tax=Actinidia rufa TaxID=165716 RepID=A0A7J0FGV0_9ERIC|nr:hypothetical protein Acr_12g0004660 [Actinidia rufa]